jgi:hypothetical protein
MQYRAASAGRTILRTTRLHAALDTSSDSDQVRTILEGLVRRQRAIGRDGSDASLLQANRLGIA